MDYSNFVILLARQRSGTNALRSVLKNHPDIFCIPEVFSNRPSPEWRLEVATNYIDFLERYTGGDLKKVFTPDDDERVFLDFLEYLRCFSDKRFLLIDVKYMSTQMITKRWRFVSEEPFLFSLIKEHKLRVLNVTRKHFLRYYLSEVKAQQSQQWDAFDESVVGKESWYQERRGAAKPAADRKVTVDVAEMLQVIGRCEVENREIERNFADYDNYLSFDYDTMFSSIGAPLSPAVLARVADWLGIANDFPTARPEYRKQSALALEEAIENYPEVAEALRAMRRARYLKDERMYSARVPSAAPTVHA